MNKLSIIFAIFFLVGCNPIPFHRTCNVPQFDSKENVLEVSYFDTTGYFEDYCPNGVPEKFTYRINNHASIGVRIRNNWIDLMPIENGVPFKLNGTGIRTLNFEGYTQAVRIDALANNTLVLTLPNSELIKIGYKFVECTCVSYDAI